MEKLKPCPFCGSTEEFALTVLSDEFDYFFVCCYHCHTRGPKKDTGVEAISAWNRRYRK